MITILYHSKDEIFFRTVVLTFLSSVYLESYWCLNMGNLNMLKERTPPPPQACLTKGCYAGCHTRWRGLEFHLLLSFHGFSMTIFIFQVFPVSRKPGYILRNVSINFRGKGRTPLPGSIVHVTYESLCDYDYAVL